MALDASLNRTGEVVRETKETQIRVRVDLDGTGVAKASTGIPPKKRATAAAFRRPRSPCTP